MHFIKNIDVFASFALADRSNERKNSKIGTEPIFQYQLSKLWCRRDPPVLIIFRRQKVMHEKREAALSVAPSDHATFGRFNTKNLRERGNN